MPRVAREVQTEFDIESDAKRQADTATAIAQIKSGAAGSAEDPLCFSSKLITVGHAPGYRDASLIFELKPSGSKTPFHAQLSVRPADGAAIVRHLVDVHVAAWNRGSGPLDQGDSETRPQWIDKMSRSLLEGRAGR